MKTKITFKRGTLEELQCLTFQGQHLPTVVCPHCQGTAHLIGVVYDETGELRKEQSARINNNEVRFWPHDACSIFLYICGNCLKATGEFTQA